MSAGAPATIGIDIGGTSVRAAVIDGDGEIHASLRDATPHTERETEDILVTLITQTRRHPARSRRSGWPSPGSSATIGSG